MDASTKITKARTKLLLHNVFFSTLALKLRPEASEMETMATDGIRLLYSPKFVLDITMEELQGVICHEVLHCAFLHHTRRGQRDPKKWNRATDYAINLLLTEDFKMELPEGGLIDTIYRGMSAEEIYNRMPKLPEDDEPECLWGKIMDAGDTDIEGTVIEQEVEWEISSKAAAEQARAAGKLPGALDELITKAQARVNWREQLHTLLSGTAKTDYSWYPPDVQYIQRRMHIPTLNEPSLGHLTFAIDSSASVHILELGQFMGELQDILDHLHFESLTIIQCDTTIQNIEELDPGDELVPKVHGRGGTRFEPVFEYCEDHQTDALIYFTDMEPFNWPAAPSFPVFWGRTQDKDAPYGTHIDVFRN